MTIESEVTDAVVVADADVVSEASPSDGSSVESRLVDGVRSDPFLVRAFLAHSAQYIGIAMVSGSVVHASTLGGNPFKYAALILAGTLVYCLKFLIESGFRVNRRLARYLAISTVVSLGTGMMSGSAQHFLDGPRAGAVLASVGVVVAYVSFCLREDRRALNRRSLTGALLVGAALFAALWSLAGSLSGSGGHH